MIKALAEFTFRHLLVFLYNQLTMIFRKQDIVLCYRYGTTGGIQQVGMHNISENGRCAWVALCAQPADTDSEVVAGINRRMKLQIFVWTTDIKYLE
jgi:hypothetical protein